MRVLDLFSGIGGFSLGLESIGMQTVAFCEQDKFCQKVLKKHWPDVPIHEDITKLDGRAYRETVELVCGGFPCQPFSLASTKRLGKEDDRALWPEMFRVIREVQPTYVIGENVPGLLSLGIDEVLSDLEGEGYATQTFVIPACAVDAPHRRDRVWVVAHADSNSEPDGSINEEQRARELVADTRCQLRKSRDAKKLAENKTQWNPGAIQSESSGEGSTNQDVADSYSKRAQRGETFRDTKGIGKRGYEQLERCFNDSEPAIWESEPPVGRVAHGVPDRTHRLKSLGNAVVPQVVAEIGRIIMKFEENQIG